MSIFTSFVLFGYFFLRCETHKHVYSWREANRGDYFRIWEREGDKGKKTRKRQMIKVMKYLFGWGYFIFLGSKITAYGDCSHAIERGLLLGRKVMTNLDSILKSRDITLPTKVRLVKAMVFPVVVYGCASWTVKKVECWKIDAFQLWCWRRLLRVP